mmetsp:Transcript_19331/g.60819  ORF Transcript_19331/g.60819 Transcript_19331/m.60819 type:complete len:291 (+) Transcript_19331:9-881(+)
MMAASPPRDSERRRTTRLRWVGPFLVVNGFVRAVAHVSLSVARRGPARWLLSEWIACVLRDALIVCFLSVATARKRPIRGGAEKTRPGRDWHAWLRLVAIAAPLDAAVAAAATALGFRSAAAPRLGAPRFVLASFAFEVVFDFFHYWTHRACHSRVSPYLARCHAMHHANADSLVPVSTYEQSAADVLVCNAIPALLALAVLTALLGPLSPPDFALLWTYKSYVEVAGHAGVHSRATSFPQFVWLPRLLGIALRTVDHDLHHSSRGRACNFSKRFTLWDRLFGTYSLPPP